MKSVFVILFINCTLFVSAQTDTLTNVTSEFSADKDKVEKIDFRIPSQDKIKEYQQDKRFKYFEEQEKKANISLFDRIMSWILDKIGGGIYKGISSGITGWVFVAILIAVIVVIIVKLAGVNIKAMFGKKKIDAPDIEIYTEDVHEMNFETLITNALNTQNYRLAVRFLYLRNLKTLSDKSIINWQANKTNYSYHTEIKDNALRSKFIDTTIIFDYVWYGEFALDEYKFSEIHNRMDDFNKTVTNER